MKNGKIYLINLGILFLYLVLLKVMYGNGALIISVLPIAVQLFTNVILGLVSMSEDRSRGLAYILSVGLVLLVGFPTCLAINT